MYLCIVKQFRSISPRALLHTHLSMSEQMGSIRKNGLCPEYWMEYWVNIDLRAPLNMEISDVNTGTFPVNDCCCVCVCVYNKPRAECLSAMA